MNYLPYWELNSVKNIINQEEKYIFRHQKGIYLSN